MKEKPLPIVDAILENLVHFGTDEKTNKKRELDATEFSCVEDRVKTGLAHGLVSRLQFLDTARRFSRLFTCLDEKRSHQFAIAVTNQISNLGSEEACHAAYAIQERMFYYQQDGVLTSGVEHFLDHLMARLKLKPQSNRAA